MQSFKPQSCPQVSLAAASETGESKSRDAAEEIIIDFAASDSGLFIPGPPYQSKQFFSVSSGETATKEEQEILLVDPPCLLTSSELSCAVDDFSNFDVLGLSNLKLQTNPFLADILDSLSSNSRTFSTFQAPMTSFSSDRKSIALENLATPANTRLNGDSVHDLDNVLPSCGESNGTSDGVPKSPTSYGLPSSELNGTIGAVPKSPTGYSTTATTDPLSIETDSQCPLVSFSPPQSCSTSPTQITASQCPTGGSSFSGVALSPLDISLEDFLAGFSMPSPVSFSTPSIEQDYLAAANGLVSLVSD